MADKNKLNDEEMEYLKSKGIHIGNQGFACQEIYALIPKTIIYLHHKNNYADFCTHLHFHIVDNDGSCRITYSNTSYDCEGNPIITNVYDSGICESDLSALYKTLQFCIENTNEHLEIKL